MTKNWWFKFDFRVWRTDSDLRRCSLETKGFWLEILCVMHETQESEITASYEELSRLVGCDTHVAARCVTELKRTNTANVTLGNGNVTLMSRRMARELNDREQIRLRVQRHRSNADVTEMKHDRVRSKSNKKEIREESASRRLAPVTHKISNDDWLKTLKKESIYAHVNFDHEWRKAELWIADHPGRKLTKTFFKNWINKIEAPITVTPSKPEMSEDEIKMREGVRKSQEMFYSIYEH